MFINWKDSCAHAKQTWRQLCPYHRRSIQDIQEESCVSNRQTDKKAYVIPHGLGDSCDFNRQMTWKRSHPTRQTDQATATSLIDRWTCGHLLLREAVLVDNVSASVSHTDMTQLEHSHKWITVILPAAGQLAGSQCYHTHRN